MADLILHPVTQAQLDAYLSAPTHALILVAPRGAGKLAIAEWLAATMFDLTPAKLKSSAYLKAVQSPDDKAIGIEAVRELEHFFRLKVPSSRAINRIAIIENSHLLTTEAQNALLKTLEEPPVASTLILTTSHAQALLPTIRSRAQTIRLLQPDLASLQTHFGTRGLDDARIKQAYSLSGGLPGLMEGLLEQTDHPLRPATERARQLLQQSAYERLLAVDELSKQRQLSQDILFILQQMAHVGVQQTGSSKRWQRILEASYRAAEALATSGQPKLILTDLMVSLT